MAREKKREKNTRIGGDAPLPSKIASDFRRQRSGPPKIHRIFGGQRKKNLRSFFLRKKRSKICLFPFGELDKSKIAHFRSFRGPISDDFAAFFYRAMKWVGKKILRNEKRAILDLSFPFRGIRQMKIFLSTHFMGR